MSSLNLSALAAAAKANDCELTLSQEGGTNFFTVGNEAMGYVDFTNYSEALAFLSDRKKLEAHRESDLCNRDDFGLCPICGAEPTILNVGRIHFAVCHEHKVYWAIGSNLFSAWRDEEPEIWEENKKLLANYKNRKDVPEQFEYLMFLEGLSSSEVLKAPSREEFYREAAKPKTPRPPLATLGDCLEATAKHVPHGYIRFTGVSNSFCEAGFTLRPITAAIDLAPVQIYVLADTPTETASEILKKVAMWLKDNELPSLSAPATAFDPDDQPF